LFVIIIFWIDEKKCVTIGDVGKVL